MTKIEEHEFSDAYVMGMEKCLHDDSCIDVDISLDTGSITFNKADITAMAEHFGLVVAPVEPTEKMSLAGMRVLQHSNSWATGIYKAMIAAYQEGK